MNAITYVYIYILSVSDAKISKINKYVYVYTLIKCPYINIYT